MGPRRTGSGCVLIPEQSRAGDDMTNQPSRMARLAVAAGRGALAGAVGVLAMTAAEKVEQSFTGRPGSYVPARALRTVVGLEAPDSERRTGWNHGMHWSTGLLLG